MEEVKDIGSLVYDDLNFNKGTTEGAALMDLSLARFGAGRSITLDKNNRIISGNKTAKSAEKAGIRKVRIIDSTGDELIAVKRIDVDLDDRNGREFAFADNITASVNLDIDYDNIRKAMEKVELHPEIWNVKMPSENALDRFSGGKNETKQKNTFKFGVYSIVLTDEENEALLEKAKEYRDSHEGRMEGFIKQLIDEYHARRNS